VDADRPPVVAFFAGIVALDRSTTEDQEMSRAMRHFFWVICLAAVGSSEAQRVGQQSTIRFGTVRSVQPVQVQSNAPTGALVGGTLGLVTSRGGRSTARNTLLGAAAGGAVASAAQGNRNAFSYTVALNDGSVVRIVSDQREIRPGDCVAVEQVRETANIRRVPSAYCAREYSQAVQAVSQDNQAAAARCEAAKEELVAATTPEAIDLASRKIDLLCN
jgi:outer membrane lipoprotein SlyB